jgi:hypothetical protein
VAEADILLISMPSIKKKTITEESQAARTVSHSLAWLKEGREGRREGKDRREEGRREGLTAGVVQAVQT